VAIILGIGLGSIRKVFLNLPSSSPPPDVESIQVSLAIKIQEVETLKAELAAAKAVIEATIPAKEREIRRASVNWKERRAERHQRTAADPEIA